MERNFYTENFEQIVKDHADQFKMTPSKKVWHGIYNDLHPGKRWPSIAMSLLFLFTLVIIGHLNTNNGYKTTLTGYNLADQEINKGKKTLAKLSTSNKQHLKRSRQNKTGNTIINDLIAQTENLNNQQQEPGFSGANLQPSLKQENSLVNNNNTDHSSKVDKSNTNNNTEKKINNAEVNGNEKNLTDNNVDVKSSLHNTTSLSSEELTQTKKSGNIILAKDDKASAKQQIKKKIKDIAQTENLEQAAAATALRLKNKNKITWVYYITPMVSYRKLSGHELTNSALAFTSAAPYQINNADINTSVVNHPALGIETGGQLTYKLSKRLQFIGGLQLNYSRYSIKANNTHPVSATLLLNSENIDRPYVVTAVSQYGNGTGPAEVTLHNYSLQASVPIGLQYTIGGNDNIQFNIAATFQPSFVIASKAYLPSTNKRNYITLPSLSRRWNMSTNIGTFISFKSNSFTWQIGPQLHYQILSTFSANYPIKERLIDYGIRFGISKNL